MIKYFVDYTPQIAILLSIMSLIWSFLNGRKLRKQQRLLNDYGLRKLKREEEEDKKADLEVIYHKEQGKNDCLIVRNVGKSPAKNVYVHLEDLKTRGMLNYRTNNIPYPLLNRNEEFRVYLFIPKHITPAPIYEISWNDDFKENNKKEFTLSF
ncbi:hypothetical protein ACILPE_06055 [Capnocytophaga canimorsus]